MMASASSLAPAANRAATASASTSGPTPTIAAVAGTGAKAPHLAVCSATVSEHLLRLEHLLLCPRRVSAARCDLLLPKSATILPISARFPPISQLARAVLRGSSQL